MPGMKVWGFLRPAVPALLIGVGVFLLGGGLWRFGVFQEPELWVYDYFVQWRSNPNATDPRIMLVELKEKDIDQIDYPLRDNILSAVLEKIEAGGADVIGVDFYRDLPEPRDGSEIADLNKTLTKYPNIIPIFLTNYDEKHPFAIPPPPVLKGDPSRIGFNNFLEPKIIRRAFLVWPTDPSYKGDPYSSFALQLAEYYLVDHNVDVAQAGDEIRLGKTVIPKSKGNDGGYVNDKVVGYTFMQDYRGPPRESSIDTLSISDVLALKDPSIFKGKIVLIGIAASSSNDTFTTPISTLNNQETVKQKLIATEENVGRVPGVFIHAQIVNQLLRIAIDGDKPTASRSLVFSWFWLALWCALGVVIGFFTRSHVLFGLATLLGVGLIVLIAWLQFLAGYWILVITPAAIFLTSNALAKAYAATHEEQERKNVMKLFSQHVSPEVAEEMWAQREVFLQGGRPAARELTVTVLFTDLKNYSTISEKMTPDQLMAWINECQGALAQHVVKNGGHINCYMGDGMMAVFGIPIPHVTEAERQQDAINAVTCAIGMAGEIKKMNAVWRAEGKPLAGLRVGIYTGKAMTGVLGVENKLAYSVIGDTVNTASRLESVDKEGLMTSGERECRILIGAQTYKYICNHFPARHVGSVNLKGKAETTEVYNVLDSQIEAEQNKQ